MAKNEHQIIGFPKENHSYPVYIAEGSALWRYQLELVKMQKKVASVCEREHITWWLNYCSLVSATRLVSTIYRRMQKTTGKLQADWFRRKMIRVVEAFNIGIVFLVFRLVGQINHTGDYPNPLGNGWAEHTCFITLFTH